MRWIKRTLRNWLRDDDYPSAPIESSRTKDSTFDHARTGVGIRIHEATNGKVIEYVEYKSANNGYDTERRPALIIVPEGGEIAEAITLALARSKFTK